MTEFPPRVLWVTEEPPDRSLGGGSIRQAYLFEALASVFPTDLLLVGRLDDPRIRELAASVTELPKPPIRRSEHPLGRRVLELAVTLFSSLPLTAYYVGRTRRCLLRALAQTHGRYQLVCVEHEVLAPLVAGRGREPWLLTFHHVLSGMIEKEIDLAPGRRQRWFRRRDLTKARRMERRALAAYDQSVVCSEADAARLAALSPREKPNQIAVVPNGVDLEQLRPSPVPAQPVVLFPASLGYGPNIDAATWLADEVWPSVLDAVPNAELLLVGASPHPRVMQLDRREAIEVHADVRAMAPYFRSARAVVVPVRVGTGTRLKALEAMAAARPVIGTTVGMDGIGVIDRAHALIADVPSDFADAVVEVLRDDALATTLASAARSHVEQHYAWDRVGPRLVNLARELMQGGRGSELVSGSVPR